MSTDYTCRLDHDHWQLYEVKGVQQVARDLSAALTEKVRAAKARLAEDDCLSARKLAAKVRDEMYVLMREKSKFGASDTEPQCVLVSELERAFGLREWSLER